ncbi:MAG: tyrosine-type recombinase/integrase [Planctomycetes bacterium]|nr:tyrosine-type recombinase/integrase [Planctomycetota bacterium]
MHAEINGKPDLSPAEIPPLISARSAAPFSGAFRDALTAWLVRTPSHDTRDNYARDLRQFCEFALIGSDRLESLACVVPWQVAAWRDHLHQQGMSASTICRKLTVLRSLFSYFRTYGYVRANPAHSDFVAAPPVPRDGKTVGLSPEECRRLLDSPDVQTPVGIRDRAILAVLAYSACRVGELVKVRVGDYKSSGGHKILEIHGKGGKERRAPLHPEAFERVEAWLNIAAIREDQDEPMFRPPRTSRGSGHDGFARRALSRRAIQFLVEKLANQLGLDSAVSVHSLRVTALTTARERGCDIIDLQVFAGHADPRTTLTYIRNRDRLSRSPAYVLTY